MWAGRLIRPPKPGKLPYNLTQQELRILRLLCEGKCNKEIAASCEIAVDTAKLHLRHVYAKIGVTSRTEAILFGASKGLILGLPRLEHVNAAEIFAKLEECHRKIEKYVGRSRMLMQQLAVPAQAKGDPNGHAPAQI